MSEPPKQELPRLDKWLVVIPARLESQRLPNKPLQLLGGLPLIVRVFANAERLRELGAELVVATDDERVVEACQKHEIQAMMTSSEHRSGTDRTWEIAQTYQRPYVLNLQGDEPFAAVNDLAHLMNELQQTPSFGMATLVYPSNDPQAFCSNSVVKAVASPSGRAIYFSRSPIPWGADVSKSPFLKHVGVYAFRRETLASFCQSPRGQLECQESLEQLRAIEQQVPILLVHAQHDSIGIDTASDLKEAEARLHGD